MDVRRLTAALALVLTLAGCGWKGEGIVVDKDYDPSYIYYTSCGKSMCPQVMPDSHELLIEDAQGDRHWVSVNSGYYEEAKPGDYWNNQEK